ncbi:MAG: hypothetical protein ONB14_00230 [candidate division KSB1 bacterium]|nr:hypothetical protein [candidate division KSB1 bacterium]
MEETQTTHNRVCPVCSHRAARRISRKWWMRLIRNSRYYSCSSCSSRFMVLADDRTVVLRNGFLRGTKRRPSDEGAGAHGEGVEEASAKVLPPEDDYARQEAQAVLELRSELFSWMQKRFLLLCGVAVIALFGLVPLVVRLMLRHEFRTAAIRASEAEQRQEAMQQEAAFYKELVGELETEVRKAQESLAQMEARIAAVSGAMPNVRTRAEVGTTGDTQAEGGGRGSVGSILEQEARRQLLQENAAYKVMVFTSKGPTDLLAQKVVERLQADNFRVASIILPPEEGTRTSIDMECTIEAAQKARQLRDFVQQLATALGEGAREVRLRYSIAEGVTTAPPEKREIRIFF